MSGVHRLEGRIRPYAWGGREFISRLLGRSPGDEPAAEYWLGAHPSAPSTVLGPASASLDQLIAGEPARWLGTPVAERYGELPFLFKVLDIAQPLSIQVHPDRAQARAGFATEEAAGIPRTARERNFKDPNPKPELAVALDDFWLLYGLREPETIDAELARFPSLQSLRITLEQGIEALFERIMTADSQTLGLWLLPVFRGLENIAAPDPEEPEYWLRQWLDNTAPDKRVDRGILGFLVMNRLHLAPGQAIFQAANAPHAYLRGRIIEIMANSDNVLRCGLTSKHVDPPALMQHLDFATGEPSLVEPVARPLGVDFPTPTDEFGLSRLQGAGRIDDRSGSAELWMALRGDVTITASRHPLTLQAGQAALVEPETDYSVELSEEADLFAARIPDQRGSPG